jgi:GR25 family glycosyltransferase involved in LPS biosynthesis
MIVIILIAVLIFFLLTWLTKKKQLIQYRIIHLKGSSNDRMNNIRKLRKILGQPIEIFDAHGPVIHPKFNLPGEFGCYKSHKTLLESVRHEPGYTIVLEDDVMFSDDFHSKVLKIIDMNLEFDILYLGNLDGNRGKRVIENVFQMDPGRLLTGTHAYLVNNKNAMNVVEQLQYNSAIDLELGELIKSGKINGLVLSPSIAWPDRSLPSGIRAPGS